MPRMIRSIVDKWGGTTAAFYSYTHMSHDLCTGLLTPMIVFLMLPLVDGGLGLNYLQAGLLMSAFQITSGLSQFLGGWLGDRFNRRTVMAVGLGGVGISLVGVGLSPTYYSIMAVLIVMGLFAGGYHPSAATKLSDSYSKEKRGKALALYMVGGTIGFTLCPILGGLIGGLMGWRYAFIILGIPSILAAIFVLLKIKKTEPITRTTTGNNTQDKSVDRKINLIGALKPIAVLMILSILAQLLAGCSISFISRFMNEIHGITPVYAAMFLAVIRGGGIAGSLLGGWLSDKWGRRNGILLTLTATGPVLYLATILPLNAALVVVFAFLGLLVFMKGTTVLPYLMDNTPQHLRATILGVYFGLAREGMSFANPVAGYYMDKYGIGKVFNVIALSNIALSVVTLLLLLKPKSHRSASRTN